MASLVDTASRAVREAVAEAWGRAAAAGTLPEADLPPFTVETPHDKGHGDLACNVALVLARPLRMPPRRVAAALLEALQPGALPGLPHLDHVEVAGPGFLNFFFRPAWLHPVVEAIAGEGPAYGRSSAGGGRRVLVEFVSANPTGPLNVVNCRAAAFGDALCSCLDWAGFRVSREFYVNDAGGQFRRLALSLEARLRQALGQTAAIPEGGYPGEYLVALAEAYRAENGAGVLDAPEGERVETLGRFAVERLLAEQSQALDRFGVHFDTWVRESAIRASGAPEQVLADLQSKGVTYRSEGAIWLRATDFGDNDDRVLVKGDGEFTYTLPDLAYHRDKFQRGFDHLIDIWGHDHHGHVRPMGAALAALGYPPEAFEVLLTQMVRVVRGGEVVKVSKRGGSFITMEDFLDEVGVDAARYFFLMRTIDSHMDFDVDLAVRQASDNPVYYVQYAHARIASILRQAASDGFQAPPAAEARLDLLVAEPEMDLLRTLAAFPDEVAAAAETRAPHRLTLFAREMAERFHTFYVQCRVLGVEPDVAGARLCLCQAVRQCLANALGILGVSAPERM